MTPDSTTYDANSAITVAPKSCRRRSATIDGTALRCPKCRASTLPRRRLFRRPRDFAIAGCCLFAWWLFCLNGISTSSIVLSNVCEDAGLYRPAIYFAECANDCRITVATGCLTCEWEIQRTFDERIQRIKRKLQDHEAEQ